MRPIIVGDIPGCGAEVEDLLDVAGYDSNGDRLLLTGDILSKGPDPIRVWERIGQTRAEMVLGNHDDRLLTHLRGIADGQPRKLKNQDHVRLLKVVTPVIEGLLPCLGGIPLFISDPKFLLVHAGINPSNAAAAGANGAHINLRQSQQVIVDHGFGRNDKVARADS